MHKMLKRLKFEHDLLKQQRQCQFSQLIESLKQLPLQMYYKMLAFINILLFVAVYVPITTVCGKRRKLYHS